MNHKCKMVMGYRRNNPVLIGG